MNSTKLNEPTSLTDEIFELSLLKVLSTCSRPNQCVGLAQYLNNLDFLLNMHSTLEDEQIFYWRLLQNDSETMQIELSMRALLKMRFHFEHLEKFQGINFILSVWNLIERLTYELTNFSQQQFHIHRFFKSSCVFGLSWKTSLECLQNNNQGIVGQSFRLVSSPTLLSRLILKFRKFR